MSWSVTVIAPEGYPDVQEPVVSFCQCPGNMYMGVQEMKETQLRHMKTPEAIEALKDLIAEVDKNNEGRFSDAYAVDADMKWSEGKETRKEWEEWERLASHCRDAWPSKTYEEFCGVKLRKRIREDAVRFLLYYSAGYQVEFEW